MLDSSRIGLAPLLLTLGVASCQKPGQQAEPAQTDSPSAPSLAKENEPLNVKSRLYDLHRGRLDPRFESLPAALPRIELLARSTLEFELSHEVSSLKISWQGNSRLDAVRPFLLEEPKDGLGSLNALSIGKHRVELTGYASADGSGPAVGRRIVEFEVTNQGEDASQEEGQHRRDLRWISSKGQYLSRTPEGAFINQQGALVLHPDQTEVSPGEQGRILNTQPGLPTVEFAFQLLIPDGYDPEVRYPVLLFLHHGWDVYRGTDNDGRPLETPLFAGKNSISSSPKRHEFPAIIVVPQLIAQENEGDVTHEWASFVSLDNETGDYKPAEKLSASTLYTFRVMDDLLSGELKVGSQRLGVDPGRLYVAGHSMGGFGTWDYLRLRPDFFAAAIPMAGYAHHRSADKLVQIPIWAFNHAADCYNPPSNGARMKTLIEAAGGSLMRTTLLEFDTEGKCDQAHFQTPEGAWDRQSGLLEWLFSQAR